MKQFHEAPTPTTEVPAPLVQPRQLLNLAMPLRRWGWGLLLVGWTIALLAPVPITAAEHPEWKEPLFTFSKGLHISIYACFAASTAWLGWPRGGRWVALVGLLAHGMFTEGMQALLVDFSHRTGKWSDVGLDLLGISIGAVLTWRRGCNRRV